MDEKIEFITEEELETLSFKELIAYKNLLRLMEENSLKGKLKEIVSEMQEDDNHMFVFYTFK